MFRHFVRARLHRRLFVWFTLGMAVTGGTMWKVGELVGGPSWRAGAHGVEQFLTDELAEHWSQPAERDRFAHALARDLGVGVTLVDAHNRVLIQDGPQGGRLWKDLSVIQQGVAVGRVQVSMGSMISHWRLAIPFVMALAALWGFLGFISRRLAWPYFQLAHVARQIGEGHVRVRAPIRRQFGEARMLAFAINEMADRIERQLREQRELLAAVSHELRTPLSRLRLLVELVRTGPVGEKPTEKLLNDMDQEAIEMDQLVGELLADARIEFGALSLKSLDAHDIAARALERAGLPESLLQVADGLPRFRADATLLLRALANLLENAKHHGGGPTRLRVQRDAEDLVFEVEDRGPGFAAGEEQRVFQPFYKGQSKGQSSDSNERPSLGLGLSLVRRIALAHEGTVRAFNRPQGGAMLQLRLPIGSLWDEGGR